MLNYRIFGQIEHRIATPLVVLHGLLGSLDNWNAFARKQAMDHRPIIAMDLRNHGDSPHVSGMSYRLMAQDVVEVIRHLELERVDLMGHSMGGKVAMTLALNQPEVLRQLLVVDIAPVSYPPRHQALLQAMLTMPLASFSNRREADQWLEPTVSQPLERAFLLKNLMWGDNKRFVWRCNLTEIARHYLNITAFPAGQQQFQGETLFIYGGQSNYMQDDGWAAARYYFPKARRERLDEAGHLPHVEVPEPFAALVNRFLS
ncbi:MAG: alpha/beta fold hydrolase [Thiothrix sp.]|nr:alpha/beta fold hydrolase [Thiothrix sp.]HPE58771.1 alpha/beta fold hydrolase [Thiolinea sp.]